MLSAIFSFPFLIANGFSILLLLLALRMRKAARLLLSLLFFGAAFFNVYKAMTSPGAYMYYGDVVVFPLYEQFIKGVFSQHIQFYVIGIAVLQAFIGAFILSKGWMCRIGLSAAVIFLVAIAPLGTGAAFPSSIVMAAACVALLEKLNDAALPEVSS